MKLVGFLHSDTVGSQDRGSYPTNIAAMRVLLRYSIPRHSLFAFVKDFLPRINRGYCDLHPVR